MSSTRPGKYLSRAIAQNRQTVETLRTLQREINRRRAMRREKIRAARNRNENAKAYAKTIEGMARARARERRAEVVKKARTYDPNRNVAALRGYIGHFDNLKSLESRWQTWLQRDPYALNATRHQVNEKLRPLYHRVYTYGQRLQGQRNFNSSMRSMAAQQQAMLQQAAAMEAEAERLRRQAVNLRQHILKHTPYRPRV